MQITTKEEFEAAINKTESPKPSKGGCNCWLHCDCDFEEPETCEHVWTYTDESFDHAFGTEHCGYWSCSKCDMPAPDDVIKDRMSREY